MVNHENHKKDQYRFGGYLINLDYDEIETHWIDVEVWYTYNKGTPRETWEMTLGGFMKWDGCREFKIDGHFCGHEQLVDLLGHLDGKRKELMNNPL